MQQLLNRYSDSHADKNLAMRAYEAVRGILIKEGELMITPQNQSYFLYVVSAGDQDVTMWVDVKVQEGEDVPEFVQNWIGDPKDTPNLVSNFLIDHPDAIFNLEGGYPVYLISGPNWKRVYTFNTLKEGIGLGFRQFGCAVKKPEVAAAELKK